MKKKDRLIGSVTEIVEDEWNMRLEEEDGGVLTVLGLYQGKREREKERIVRVMKEFLVQAWWKRNMLHMKFCSLCCAHHSPSTGIGRTRA